MRLTRKTNIGYLEEPIGDGEIYTHDQKLTNIDNIIQKLGQLEDIMEKYGINSAEELERIILNDAAGEQAFREYFETNVMPYRNIEKELGISLVTLIKAISNGVWVKTKNDISKHLTVVLKKRHHTKEYWLFYRPYSHVYLKDYGKTWALSKEELSL